MISHAPLAGGSDDRDVNIGRVAQRRMAREALAAGRLLVVSGEVGIGKSAFVDAVAAEMAAAGSDVVLLRATASSQEVPLGVFAPLLADAPATAEPVELLREVLRALRDRAVDQHVVVVVDDVHLLDGRSVALVEQIVAGDIGGVALAYRTGEALPVGIEALGTHPRAVPVALPPLPPEEAEALVAAVAGGRLPQDAVDEICRMADGVPLFLVTLTRDRVESPGGAGGGGTSLRAAVEARLARLAPAERTALEYVALAEPLELAVAERLAAADVLDALERRRLVRVDEARRRTAVRLGHPLFGEVLRAALPALRKRSLLRDLVAARAEVVPDRRRHDVLRKVLWQMDGGLDVAADELARAAAAATSLGGADVALRLARAAWERQRSSDTASLLALALLGAGQMHELDAFCESLPVPEEETHRTQLAVTWSIAAFAGLGDAARAMAIIDRFRPLVGSFGRYELDSIDVMARFYAGQVASAVETGERVLAAPGLPSRARLLTSLPLVLALGTAGRTAQAVTLGSEALRLAPVHGAEVAMAETSALCVWGHSMAWTGEPSACAVVLEERRQEAHAALDHASAEVIGVTLGIARMVEGRFEEAAALYDEFRPSASLFSLNWLPYAQAWRALCLARMARVEEARAVAVASPIGGPDAAHHGFRALATAEIARASHGPAAAAAALDAAHDVGPERGQCLLALLMSFRAFSLEPTEARAQRVLSAVHHHDGRLAVSMAATVERWRRHDLRGVTAAAVAAESQGLGMLALEIWDLALASGPAMGAAPAQQDRCRRQAAEARARITGEEAPAERDGPATMLTPAERTVARAAAAGRSDREIADSLGVSVRTIHAHLRTIYRKLGLRGRGELPGHPLLAGGDE